ncbi:SDR family NAD(P)-dependent oxidoreductase [Sphingobium nicotianae]|uniref:NADP-dependent 3-hydroxy acid dehydrogenase YdfG n=1 Tax=Sphingobium nicotianae TaxID=2782607 RepID=A0A9X1IRV6_9SPHN|nr:SDR family oxidoreductase [Sphingobium nicotianae]MBT2187767.1 SDR family oxidoreductase [Sphingobium nicotianae]
MTTSSLGTALVTGASTGIGAVYADRLAHRGYDLILVARNGERLDALAQRLRAETGRTVDVVVADLTKSEDVARVEQRLADDASITLLINNAGMSLPGGTLENSSAEIETIVALNITAVARLAIAAGKAFTARGAGKIVNIASILGIAYEISEGVYSGSKGFVINLSRSLAGPARERGVQVQAVLPGATRTEIWERSGKNVDDLPADWVMDVSDLVDAALVGLDRGEEVTIPPLADEQLWLDYDKARAAMVPNLSRREVAPRYRVTEAA